MYRCGSNKSPATRKEVASTNERRKSILKEEKKRNRILQRLYFKSLISGSNA